MPYKVEGNKVLHLKDGKWTVKQVTESHENAVKAARLLYALEKNPDMKRQK